LEGAPEKNFSRIFDSEIPGKEVLRILDGKVPEKEVPMILYGEGSIENGFK
jgi:hypothetical protein